MLPINCNSLPNEKILDVTKLKAFADDKINVAQKMVSVFDRIENIVGKGENAGYHHFLLFPQCFQDIFLGVVKSRDCVVKSSLSKKAKTSSGLKNIIFNILHYSSPSVYGCIIST